MVTITRKNKLVKFSFLPRRITLECNPPVYTWLWFAFGYSVNGELKKISIFDK